MNHFYRNVPGLGNVAVSRHAQEEARKDRITDTMFADVLLNPVLADIPEGNNILWREKNGIRLVIIVNPEPNRGAKLVKTVYRVQPQAKARA